MTLSSPVAVLQGADQRFAGLLERLTVENLAAATPCHGWDVRALVSHTLQSVEAFSAAVDGGPAPTAAELFSGADILGEDPAGRAKEIFERSHRAWSSVEDWDATVSTVIGEVPASQAVAVVTFSTLVHSWDLAWALGERVEFTPTEATLAEAVGGELIPPTRPQGLFGAEVHPPIHATATQRVIAFTGREPL
ncbi:MAG: TIGR03086 family metal-binding protein [Sporichthyaceae bacterium]